MEEGSTPGIGNPPYLEGSKPRSRGTRLPFSRSLAKTAELPVQVKRILGRQPCGNGRDSLADSASGRDSCSSSVKEDGLQTGKRAEEALSSDRPVLVGAAGSGPLVVPKYEGEFGSVCNTLLHPVLSLNKEVYSWEPEVFVAQELMIVTPLLGPLLPLPVTSLQYLALGTRTGWSASCCCP